MSVKIKASDFEINKHNSGMWWCRLTREEKKTYGCSHHNVSIGIFDMATTLSVLHSNILETVDRLGLEFPWSEREALVERIEALEYETE